MIARQAARNCVSRLRLRHPGASYLQAPNACAPDVRVLSIGRCWEFPRHAPEEESPARRNPANIPLQLRSMSSVPGTVATSSGVATTSSDGVIGEPIDFDVASKIEGNESQIVTIELRPQQVLRAESGAMMYMTDGVEMQTTTGGGISTGFSRMLTGQNFFISDYRYTKESGVGTVALGTDFPSKIVRLSVEQYGKLVCQKGALLCASHTVDIQMEFSKNMTSGFFGGEGFVLQVSATVSEGDASKDSHVLHVGVDWIRRCISQSRWHADSTYSWRGRATPNFIRMPGSILRRRGLW